jgi:hypothetical protein
MKGSHPDRMPVYGPGLRKKPRKWLWSLRATAPRNSHCTPKNFVGFSLRHTDHFIFSSTLLTLSSSDWTLSVRVPTRSVALTRGTPMSCSTS